MLDIKLHISAVKQPFSISVLENLLSYEGLSDVTDILTFGCFYSQTHAVNVELDGLTYFHLVSLTVLLRFMQKVILVLYQVRRTLSVLHHVRRTCIWSFAMSVLHWVRSTLSVLHQVQQSDGPSWDMKYTFVSSSGPAVWR